MNVVQERSVLLRLSHLYSTLAPEGSHTTTYRDSPAQEAGSEPCCPELTIPLSHPLKDQSRAQHRVINWQKRLCWDRVHCMGPKARPIARSDQVAQRFIPPPGTYTAQPQWQLVLEPDCPHHEHIFFCVQSKQLLLQFVPIVSHPPTMHHYEEPSSIFLVSSVVAAVSTLRKSSKALSN